MGSRPLKPEQPAPGDDAERGLGITQPYVGGSAVERSSIEEQLESAQPEVEELNITRPYPDGLGITGPYPAGLGITQPYLDGKAAEADVEVKFAEDEPVEAVLVATEPEVESPLEPSDERAAEAIAELAELEEAVERAALDAAEIVDAEAEPAAANDAADPESDARADAAPDGSGSFRTPEAAVDEELEELEDLTRRYLDSLLSKYGNTADEGPSPLPPPPAPSERPETTRVYNGPTLAPERMLDFAGMRELANASARNKIQFSDRGRFRSACFNLALAMILTLLCMGLAALSSSVSSAVYHVSVAVLMLGLFFGVRFWRISGSIARDRQLDV